jgi:PRTRC genetic system protein C
MALKTTTLPREFILDGRKLADPNSAMSIDEVRAHYTGIYPALNNSSYEEQLTERARTITFTTSIGHKG